MRKKRGYGRRPKENLKKHWRLWILVFLLLSLLFILYQNLKPSVMAYARMNTDSLMSTIANEALRQSLQGYEKGSEELLRYYYDD